MAFSVTLERLRVPEIAEHAYLHELARPQRVAGRGRQPIRRGVRLLLEGMRDIPAIIVDHRMVIVAENTLGHAVFGLTEEPGSRDRERHRAALTGVPAPPFVRVAGDGMGGCSSRA